MVCVSLLNFEYEHTTDWPWIAKYVSVACYILLCQQLRSLLRCFSNFMGVNFVRLFVFELWRMYIGGKRGGASRLSIKEFNFCNRKTCIFLSAPPQLLVDSSTNGTVLDYHRFISVICDVSTKSTKISWRPVMCILIQ